MYNVRSSQTVATAFFSLDAAARACLDPFVPVFLRHHGLSALQAGAILSVAAVLSGVFVPAAMWLPKWRRNSWRAVLLASSIVSVVSYVSLLAIPAAPGGNGWVPPCTADSGTWPAVPGQGIQGVAASNKSSEEVSKNTTRHPVLFQTYEALPTAVPLTAPEAGNAAPNKRVKRVRRQAVLLQGNDSSLLAVGPKYNVVTPAPSPEGTVPTSVLPGKANELSPVAPVNNTSNASTVPGTAVPNKDKKNSLPEPVVPPNCRGGLTGPECLATNDNSASSQGNDMDPFLAKATLLLLGMAVILGSSMLALAKLVADESYFHFLDEIDATEKSRSHETYAAVVTALVLGAVAILASQTPCLPLATWGFQEVYLAAFGTLIFASLPLAAFFPEPHQPLRRQATSGACRGVVGALKNFEGGLIALGLLLLGTVAGLEQAFFMWNLEENGQKMELGVVLMARAVSNVASLFLLCAGGLPSRLLPWLGVAIVCASARSACYVQSGWELAAAAQLLSPPSTVLLWVACERWARRSSTRLSTERGLMVVMRCCHSGLGFCIGSLVGGLLASWLGVRVTLGVNAVVGTLLGLAIMAASRFVAARPPSYDRLLWDPTSPNSDSESEEELKMAGDASAEVSPSSPVAS